MAEYEKSILAQAGPYMLAARARAINESEVIKGCDPVIWPQPVSLEPCFTPIMVPGDVMAGIKQPEIIYPIVPNQEDILRFRVWISPTQEFRWNRCELFIKQLAWLNHRAGLELVGNKDRIAVYIICHRQDQNVVDVSFGGKCSDCLLSVSDDNPINDINLGCWSRIALYDFFTSPPYFHLLTRPDEFKDCPYESLINAFSKIPSDGLGICQIMFEPVSPDHNWHRNVQILTDFEYVISQASNMGTLQRYAQQTPSGDLHMMGSKMETKAHNDKPFFATAFRIAILGTDNNSKYIRPLSAFSSIFQHGGKPLNFITQQDYMACLSIHQIRKMFTSGLTFRPGFLLNSFELTGLAHIPQAAVLEAQRIQFDRLEPLSVDNINVSDEGTLIGYTQQADTEVPVFIPDRQRLNHTHIIGKTDKGKSLLEEHMILSDIKEGHGVAVLDPHGDMARDLLYHIPEEYVDKVIFFNPGDPEYVPIWNPMSSIGGQDIGRTTDDLIGVLKSFVTGWGDRMEHLLRHGIYGLKHIAGTSLLDVCELLQKGSKTSKDTRELILKVVDSELARKFWMEDFETYSPNEFGPPKHKLSKLLLGGTSAKMLSQPFNYIDFARIMNEGYIFIADLSMLGNEIRNILGGFLLAVMHMTALGRNIIPIENRKTFYIYLDEAHRFVTESMEDTIVETRKYGVGMTLSHQFLKQFGTKKVDALSSVGSTIVFQVDTRDAGFLVKDFQEKADSKDFFNLDVGDAIVRINNDVAKIKTPPPLDRPARHFYDRIISNSRQKYCKPTQEVLELIKRRSERSNQPFSPLVPPVVKGENNISRKRTYERFRGTKTSTESNI